MLDITGKIINISTDINGRKSLTIDITDCDIPVDTCKDYMNYDAVDIKLSKHKEDRSKEANAYFHVLVRKIAKALTIPFAQAKNQLIWKYGQPQLTESGEELVYWSEAPTDFMATYEAMHTWPVAYDGNMTAYAIYRSTATYSKEEMCQLIDGTVADAKELGIETEPPVKEAEMKEAWTPETSG